MHRVMMVGFLGLLACSATGAVIPFDLAIEISGATPPAGVAPWLNATFDDGGTPGSVTLTMAGSALTGSEFVAKWLFNLDPALELDDLAFAIAGKTGSFDDPVITTSTDTYKADGDGFFDIKVAFANYDGSSVRFGPGDALDLTITGISTLTADAFDFISEPNGGAGEYRTVAHVQGIGPDSGWVATPEPGTLALLAAAGSILIKRKRKAR